MKVLLVHKFLHVTGGAEVFLFETARALEHAGHEVAFFSTHDSRNRATEWEQYFVDVPHFRSANPLARVGSIRDIVYSDRARVAIRRLIAHFKPDIVHVFNLFTHLSPSILDECAAAGVPVVMTCNDYKHICPNYKLYHHHRICEECSTQRFYRAIVNRCCQDSLAFSTASAIEAYAHERSGVVRRGVSTFLFSSDFMARKTGEFWGEGSFRWRKLPNPFDAPSIAQSPADEGYCLFNGRLVYEKGADVLLEAMSRLPQVRLVLVGDGPEEAELRRFAAERGLDNVEFRGGEWGRALEDRIAAARFVVVPSVWHENVPYAVLQAFARGKAVVAANRGGIPELVTDGERGLLYEAQDPIALADAIRRLWEDPERASAMGAEAKHWVDAEFNDALFIETLESIYADVVAQARGDGR